MTNYYSENQIAKAVNKVLDTYTISCVFDEYGISTTGVINSIMGELIQQQPLVLDVSFNPNVNTDEIVRVLSEKMKKLGSSV